MKIFKAAPEKINYCLPWKIPSDAHIGHGLKLFRKMCWTWLKTIGHSWKNLGTSQKTLCSP